MYEINVVQWKVKYLPLNYSRVQVESGFSVLSLIPPQIEWRWMKVWITFLTDVTDVCWSYNHHKICICVKTNVAAGRFLSWCFLHHEQNSLCNIVLKWSQKSRHLKMKPKVSEQLHLLEDSSSPLNKVWCFVFFLFGWVNVFKTELNPVYCPKTVQSINEWIYVAVKV